MFFFISIAQWSVEADDTIIIKVAEGKGKTCGEKIGKTGKCSKERNNESTYSFQNYDSRRLLMFLFKAGTCTKKKKPRFNIMYGQFWFDGDFFVRNLDASVELRQYRSLQQRIFFLFLTECYSFFLLWAGFWFFF